MNEGVRFHAGDRVRVSQSFTWAQGAIATVSEGEGITTSPFGSYVREVAGVAGPSNYYWLLFDEPQIDAEGDGPYIAAEISEEYLEAT